MRKKLISMMLILALCAVPAVQTAAAVSSSAAEAYSAMTALKSQYPEGMPWTNGNYYKWNGGIYSGGYGCAGFAFRLSDEAFGQLPARKLTSFSYSDVRVGDILRLYGDTHSVIVLEVHTDRVVIAEGNYNNSVHWGRVLTRGEVLEANYLMTRWPEGQPEPEAPPADLAYASTQTVLVDGREVGFQMYALKDANGYLTNYIKLRDLAQELNGTKAQFEVGWDGAVNIETGKPYTTNGSEMKTPYSGDRAYTRSAEPTNINGTASDLVSFVLTDDNGGAYTYYQLRDLGRHLGFNVGWDGERGIIFVETDKPYAG